MTREWLGDARIARRVSLALLAFSALLMWLPALRTPFWGDDYLYLFGAHATNLSGAPWWSDFVPAHPLKFWRPLSQEGYWRLVDALLHGNPYATHVVSLCLHLLASMGVALLGLAINRACRWPSPRLSAAFAGTIYAGLAMHLLPVHWAAAINNSLLTLFTTLCLAAWVAAAQARRLQRTLLLASIPASLALALLTKESAALTVALMVIVRVFTGQVRPRTGEIATLLACIGVTAVWLLLRARFTTQVDPAYSLVFGTNVIRNAVALVAWLANVPREAIRMATSGMLPRALAWIAATALPMLAACTLALWQGRSLLRPRQWLCIVAFAGIGYGPYFLLAWNSYAYYAAIAAILATIALAHCTMASRHLSVVVALLAFSSWIAVEGTRQLDAPGLIGRARWGESLLQSLSHDRVDMPLWVQVRDLQRFYAVGPFGLAWRLQRPVESIHVTARCPTDAQCLVIDDDGTWRLRQAEAGAR